MGRLITRSEASRLACNETPRSGTFDDALPHERLVQDAFHKASSEEGARGVSQVLELSRGPS